MGIGFIRGAWRITSNKSSATLLVDPLEPLAEPDRVALAEEGARLLAFAAANGQAHDVLFTADANSD